MCRRKFLTRVSTAVTTTAVLSACGKENGPGEAEKQAQRTSNLLGDKGFVPVITPGIKNLPYTMDGDVKVFNLIAEPVTIQFPDLTDGMGMTDRPVYGWGYNGSIIGPTIEVVEGDRVRIIVENKLPEPTTVHWHGIHLPIDMDGVEGFSQKPIPPGGSFTYEFTLIQHGTFLYHPHFMGAKQAGLGMGGFFIVHPKNPEPWMIVDKDYAYFLQIWYLPPGTSVPDQLEMTNFNYFTMNGVPAPKIVPMDAKIGEKVRIRVINLSMMTHPIHLHGHTFKITERGAGFLPESQHMIANTEDISAAESRCLDFVAGPYPGKWMFHCHFMHHVMNDMDRPTLPGGAGMGDMIMMGGMTTWIEVT